MLGNKSPVHLLQLKGYVCVHSGFTFYTVPSWTFCLINNFHYKNGIKLSFGSDDAFVIWMMSHTGLIHQWSGDEGLHFRPTRLPKYSKQVTSILILNLLSYSVLTGYFRRSRTLVENLPNNDNGREFYWYRFALKENRCRQETQHNKYSINDFDTHEYKPYDYGTGAANVKATLMYQMYTVHEYRANLVRRCQPLSNITVYTYIPWLIEKFAYVIEFIAVTILFQRRF